MDRRLFLNALLSAAVGQRLLPAAAVEIEPVLVEPGFIDLSGVMMPPAGDRLIVYQHPGGWALYSIRQFRVPEGRLVWHVRHIPRANRAVAGLVGISGNESMAEQMTADHFRRHYASTEHHVRTCI